VQAQGEPPIKSRNVINQNGSHSTNRQREIQARVVLLNRGRLGPYVCQLLVKCGILAVNIIEEAHPPVLEDYSGAIYDPNGNRASKRDAQRFAAVH